MLKYALLIVILAFTFANNVQCEENNNLPADVLHYLLYTEPNHHLEMLGNVSDIPDSLKRTFLRPGHRRAATLLQRWMVEAGMMPWLDAVANVRGRTASSRSGPALMIGSHYDTVIDGGKYDGALGIVAGIAAVKTALLNAAVAAGVVQTEDLSALVKNLNDGSNLGRLDLRTLLSEAPPVLRRPIEVTAFSDEEGVRFQSTFLGSLALADQVLAKGLLRKKDPNGMTLEEALEEAGMDTSQVGFHATSLSPGEIDAYVEIHMEQGPVLESVHKPLGAVSAIAGQTRLQANLIGTQGHAGTVPMKLRKDPLAAAAELIAELERICGGGRHPGAPFSEELSSDKSLVCTVGSISLWPNASNVIPARANFTIDIRSRNNVIRMDAVKAFDEYMTKMCERRGLQCMLENRHEANAVECDSTMIESLTKSITDSSYVLQQVLEVEKKNRKEKGVIEPSGDACTSDSENSGLCSSVQANKGITDDDTAVTPVLVSGAGHDAMVMANITRMGMVFVRCKDGVSHSPDEYVAPEDVAAAVGALYEYIRKWSVRLY